MRPDIDQPTTFLRNASITAGRQGRPSPVPMQMMPRAHSLLRASTSNTLSTRFTRGSPISTAFARLRFLLAPLRLQPQLAHDGEHPLLADDDAVASELAVDPAVPVAALVKIEPLGDEALQGLPLDLRVGLPPLHVAVVFGFRHAQDPACLPDGAEPAPMPFEELAPHAWPWLDEKTRKFFSSSFSRSSSSILLRSFAIS